ncbi:MAG: hypothetical protein A2Z16_14795 [Chloroflexi bacterium RBG_16_54_18]|nr:MAG: hypothetical protein A2Z16_14795 [Chloroflexi bacterium RBG_16_54_18]
MKLLTNARIYTFMGELPAASAIAIDGERIIAVAETRELRRRFKNQVEEFNLNGLAVIPGLVDAHIHLEHYALGLQKVDCETATKAECLRRVEQRARQMPPGEWILGHGWNQNSWSEGYGTIQELDAVATRNPVFLTAKSLHAAWVNSQAFQIAGIRQETKDPPYGAFGRDQQARLTGVIYENAVSLVEKIIPAPSVEMVAAAIETAQEDLWKKGLTGVHDFDRQRCFSALQLLHGRGLLRLRVLKSIPFENLNQAVEIGLHSGFGDDFIRVGGIKIFSDGALGPRTAAMLQPYENEPENRGMAFLDGEELFTIGREAVDSGLSLAVHAIGDRANHEVLNGLERLREYQNQGPSQPLLPHRIEHVQIIHPDDAPRLSALGIVASMQPVHATSDLEMAEHYWGIRSAWSYGFKSQLDFGARLVFGSDAPVESPNPFLGVHAAVTRRRLDGEPGVQGWYPKERLTVQQALEAYTLAPADISGMGDRLGKIAPGYLADLVVLEKDPFTCQPDDLHRIKPVKTMVAGDWVFEA